jgi:hypothetical protein
MRVSISIKRKALSTVFNAMSDIQIAIDQIKAKQPICQMFIDYYNGNHRLAFASKKFTNAFGDTLRNMRDNLCPIVVEAPADRMEVLNFSGDNTNKAVADAAWNIWTRETLELTSYAVHVEAMKCGYAYLIVWADKDNKAKFYVQDSRQCVVIEDDSTGEPLFGAKQWLTTSGFTRLTLYYADRIEKYITSKKADSGGGDTLKEAAFVPFNGEGPSITPNPFGVIPMFKFETNPVLNDAIPIQDALNKTICDELIAQEFAAYPQRFAIGLQLPTNETTGQKREPFKAGVDRLWVSEDATTKFGEFLAADLEKFIKVEDSRRLEMARVTGTPTHFFNLNASDNRISGEALKTLESRFTKKVRRLTLNFGTVWADAMELALTIEGTAADNITTQWQSPEQRSEQELWTTLGLKADLGVPEEICWEEAGYTEEDIARFRELQAANPEPPPGPVVDMNGNPVDQNGVPVNAQKKAA